MGLSSSLISSLDKGSSEVAISNIFLKCATPLEGFLLKSVIAFFNSLFLVHYPAKGQFVTLSYLSTYFFVSILTMWCRPSTADSNLRAYWLRMLSIRARILGW
jgi:hypothetical protein